jgi:hypothetical protein
LEYPDAPGTKALPESTLPEPVKARLSDWQKVYPASRLLLIRREGQQLITGDIHFFVGSSKSPEAMIIECHLPAYETLLEIDPTALLEAELPAFGEYRQTPLFLVCTNGKRDPCCARHGVAVYHNLSRLNPGSVWQSSHMGGHRFAANVIILPEGIYYGRVEENTIESLLRTASHRQLYLPNLRGRSCYSPVAQAADYYLRMETGNLELSAYTLVSESQIDLNTWLIKFVDGHTSNQYALTIQKQFTTAQINESCGATEQTHVANFIRLH